MKKTLYVVLSIILLLNSCAFNRRMQIYSDSDTKYIIYKGNQTAELLYNGIPTELYQDVINNRIYESDAILKSFTVQNKITKEVCYIDSEVSPYIFGGILFAAFVPVWTISVPYGLLVMTTNTRDMFDIKYCNWQKNTNINSNSNSINSNCRTNMGSQKCDRDFKQYDECLRKWKTDNNCVTEFNKAK